MAKKKRRRAPPPPKRAQRSRIERRIEERTAKAIDEEFDLADRSPDGGRLYEISMSAAIQAAAFRGLMLYIQHPGITVRQVWETSRLNDDPDSPLIREVCSWTAFSRWARKNQWRRKRKEHWAGIERRVLAMMQSKRVREEIDEIIELTAASERLQLHIHGGKDADGKEVKPVQPKSLEGAVSALIAVDKRKGDKRRFVIEETAGAASEEEEGAAHSAGALPGVVIEDALTDEEARMMARTISRKRAGVIDAREGDPEEGEE